MAVDERAFPANEKPAQKIQTLIIGRLMTIFLLLVASWVWNSGHLKLSYDDFPRGLFLIFVISVGLTIVYFFVLRLSEDYYWQIRAQFLIDAFLVTSLVWRTGDVTSPYITLYIVLISVAGLFLGKRATLMLAGLCVFLFCVLSSAAYFAYIQSSATTSEIAKIVQIVGFHSVAFLVVGLLSARLSERYASSEELEAATKTLANLRVLHERIIESIRSGLITIDLEGKIYTFNATAEEITGHSAEEMQGRSIFSLFGDIKKEIEIALTNENHKREFQQRYEIGFSTPDGFVVQLGYSISPLYSEAGEKTGLIITFQDLTDIRSMEESVRRKDRLAAVGRVAAGLAHEIRNPLGAMRGAIQLLESKTSKDSSQANLMEIILRESDRLNGIITNFLKYARPKASQFLPIDLRRPIEDTITLLRHSPNVSKDHILTTELPDQPVDMTADEDQLKQIFWNLSRNSIQSMPDGGTLNVSLKRVGRNRVTIVFSDTGCGMTPNQVEQLFEPFSKSTTGGTGLGLSIVYQIVRDHHGTITVSSREGGGTDINIHLPTDMAKNVGTDASDDASEEARGSNLGEFLNVKKGESSDSS
ncbi:MAG: PAS domain S-box protein [Acidobacteria bacterium]|nr:PAS domain S-box protein [Acidobacteriota bacterium]